jgi:glycosyltransferase involved in cell wall biosynthesis
VLQQYKKILTRIKSIINRPAQKVDILVVNTFQKTGGAGRAAYRNFLAIKGVYSASHYLTLIKNDIRSDISGYYHRSIMGFLADGLTYLDRFPILHYRNRQKVTFTPAYWGNPLRFRLSRFSAKVVHLHWITLGVIQVEELIGLSVPVIWTLHDAWAFTGGCHYTAGCENFKQQCGKCPQLGSEREHDLSRSLWLRKRAAFEQLNLIVVAPSRWLADMARQSNLFSGCKVEVIPNGLDTEIFKPMDKKDAKAYLGVSQTNPVLLFGAVCLTDQRKGGDLLCEAITQLDFPCTLLMFGEGRLPLVPTEFVTVKTLGRVSDDSVLAVIYSAADVFICPSREDNLPNTVAEAFACGTPCAAFNVNGLPDMIDHKLNGWLAKSFDPVDLALGIRWLATNSQSSQLQKAARNKALAEYSIAVMAERYGKLYAEYC